MKHGEIFETGQEPEFVVQGISRTELIGDGLMLAHVFHYIGGGIAQTQFSMVLSRRAAQEIGRELIRLATSGEREFALGDLTPETMAVAN